MSPSPDGSGPWGIRTSLANAGHAVVVGGGMAGLLAARVRANHFEQVTLVERDTLPERPQSRKGVPQGRMLHSIPMILASPTPTRG
ncbi:MAG TPA: hypothetical protein VN327_06725 [Pseudonocardiaceae bacterium]|nr:hypothetical protein [Pseudonocardiaceae bacterium]